jgi:spindle assembly abnormal protein 6
MSEKDKAKGTFNRYNPLLEKKHVPCEFIKLCGKKNGSAAGSNILSRRRESFTLRVLEGHRTNTDHGGIERAIRLEISDEFRRQCSNKANGPKNSDGNPFSPFRGARRANDGAALSMLHMISSPITSNNMQSSQKCSGEQNINFQANSEYKFGEMSPMDSQPIELYELEVGESDFAALQQDQALLVDFSNFSKSFINLLRLCDLGSDDGSNEKPNEENRVDENKENLFGYNYYANPLLGCQMTASGGIIGEEKGTPKRSSNLNPIVGVDNHEVGVGSMYTCRIEELSSTSMNSWSNKNGTNVEKIVRFSIVESNQFRELTHLSLNLMSGGDASVRSYLSTRLSEALGSIAMLKYHLQKEMNRASSAEMSNNDISKRFHELVAATEQEKNALVHEADETIQKQNARKDKELQAVKERCDHELHELKASAAKMNEFLTSEIDRLKSINEQLKAEIRRANEDNNVLTNRLEENENETKVQSVEMKHLHDRLDEEKNQREKTERELQKIKEAFSSVQKLNEEKGIVIQQMEEKVALTSLKSQEAHDNSESYAVRLHATEQELNAMKEEYSKTEELLSKYQCDRQEMKRRMKSKVDLIQKQEEILASKEFNSTETQQQLEKTQKEMMSLKQEVSKLKKELDNANKINDENKEKMANDQQVSELVRT